MKLIRKLFFLIFSIFVVIMGSFACYGGNNGIEIEANIGFNKIYKVDNITPFEITLTNHGQSFSGEMQIEIMLINDTYRKEHEIHAIPVELPQNSSKTVNLEFPVPTVQRSFEIKLVDKKGDTVANKVEVVKAIEPGGLLFGVVSDNKDGLSYTKQMMFETPATDYRDYRNYYSTYPSIPVPADGGSSMLIAGERMIFFDEKTFPATASLLSNFNMLIINDFDAQRLSNEQADALTLWVKSGGVLSVGTGENYAKVTRGLSGLFGDIDYSGLSEDTSGIVLASFDGTHEIGTGDYPYTKIFEAGNGKLIIHAFDLSQPYFSETKDAKEILSEIYSEFVYMHAYQYDSLGINNPWLLRRLPTLNGEGLNAVIFIVFAYILFIGPILYVILKKKDIREKGLYIIPAVSVTVTLIVYILSLDTLYGGPILNIVSVTGLDEDNTAASSNVYLTAFSPNKGDMYVSYPENFEFRKAWQTDYYRYNYSYQQEKEDRLVKKTSYGDKIDVIYYDNKKWDSNYAEMSAVLNIDGGLDTDFYIEDGFLKGKITNNMAYNFEDILITIGDNSFVYTSLNSGQSIDINEKFNFDVKNNYYIYNVFTDVYDRAELEKMYGSMRAFQLNMRNDIANNIIEQNYGGGYDTNVTIYAITGENLFSGLYIDNKSPYTVSNNVFIKSARMDFSNSKTKSIPFGIIKPDFILGNADYNYRGNTINIYDQTELLVGFKVPEDFNADIFEIDWQVYEGLPEIYNMREERWEELVVSAEYGDDIKKYIDKDRSILIRLEDISANSLEFPKIRLERG